VYCAVDEAPSARWGHIITHMYSVVLYFVLYFTVLYCTVYCTVLYFTVLYCTVYCTVDEAPSARWGHALCMISENEALLIGGQGDKNILCKDAVWQLDMCN